MKRKILSFITAVSMILSLIILPQTASATWDGGGTEADPYQIATAQDLQSLATAVNGGETQSGTYFIMTQDIDLSAVCGADIDGSEVSWTPIGIHNSYEFGGTFDGDGHKIKNLYIKSNESYHSLFSVNNGTIKNLSVSGIINGDQYIGGICSLNLGERIAAAPLRLAAVIKSAACAAATRPRWERFQNAIIQARSQAPAAPEAYAAAMTAEQSATATTQAASAAQPMSAVYAPPT